MSTKKEALLVKQLLEAGVHFGHQTRKWNPKMEKFIFGEKEGIYVIDLEKTAALLLEACKFLNEVTLTGSYVLFVGTKKQAAPIIKEEAQKCGMFYVNHNLSKYLAPIVRSEFKPDKPCAAGRVIITGYYITRLLVNYCRLPTLSDSPVHISGN